MESNHTSAAFGAYFVRLRFRPPTLPPVGASTRPMQCNRLRDSHHLNGSQNRQRQMRARSGLLRRTRRPAVPKLNTLNELALRVPASVASIPSRILLRALLGTNHLNLGSVCSNTNSTIMSACCVTILLPGGKQAQLARASCWSRVPFRCISKLCRLTVAHPLR